MNSKFSFGKGFIILITVLFLYVGLWGIENLVLSLFTCLLYQKIAMVILVILFGIVAIILGNNLTKEDTRLEFQRELNFVRSNFIVPLFWGSGIGLIFIAGNGLFFDNIGHISFIRNNIFSISGILLGIISTLVLFKSIFHEIAPIASIEKFLRMASQDLEEKRYSKDGRVWLVYPALNIGYYREQIDAVPLNYYSEFMTSLNYARDNPKVDVNVVTFPVNLYEKLFEKYIDKNTDSKSVENVQKCTNEANAIFNSFKEKNHTNCKIHNIEPHKFPDHFLIIDNKVYLINTFGLPEYNPDTKDFIKIDDTKENSKEKLAKVYIYKQEDKILADLLIEKFELQNKPKTTQDE